MAVSMTGAHEPPLPPSPSVNVAAVTASVLGRWAEARTRTRQVIANPDLWKVDGLTVDSHRDRVMGQLHLLAASGLVHRAFPAHLGGSDDPGGNIAAFEDLVLADPSLQIKAGVQWGLFGSTVLHLGTQDHHDRFLPGIMDLTTPGVFAMTETGHGSDVAHLATTATFDPGTGMFDLHTPDRSAWKDYLGNAAVHGKAAVVFAQLRTATAGQEPVSHGVHAFWVPIRDEAGTFLPGVGGNDDGVKGGLNGIDNGRLHFTHVAVPRENLLDRYGQVHPDGSYTSPIANPNRRFFTMLGTLVQGRVSLVGASVAAARMACTVAVRYGASRRQFRSPGAETETALLDYQTHQRRLLPNLAATYAYGYAHEQLLETFHSVFSADPAAEHSPEQEAARERLEVFAAALKPAATWHAVHSLQAAREACGGQGFLAENQLVGWRADLDVYTTFEGDNTVLLQLVAKRLLAQYGARAGAGLDGVAQLARDHVADTARSAGFALAGQVIADRGSTARAVGYLREEDAQRELLSGRVHAMTAHLANQLRKVRALPAAEAAALVNAHQQELVDLALAWVDLNTWEALNVAVHQLEAQDPGTGQVMMWLRDLHGLHLVETHAAWYLVQGRLTPARVQAITAYINTRLLPRLREHAVDLVDGFGYGPEQVRAPIAWLGQQG
jgi:acyl-CoA oxidase